MPIDYSELPEYLQDNNYIHTGHRPQTNSFLACFQSILEIHTETVNIWTHMLGCLGFAVLAIVFYVRTPHLEEKLILAPFFLGAILCMGFSFVYHTVCCHSPLVEKIFQRLDYCGISLLILGSMIPWIFYGFYCHFWLKTMYLSFASMLGVGAIVVSMLERFGRTEYRWLRSCVFTVFGMSGALPALHILALEGWTKCAALGTPLVVTGVLYTLGSALYTARVPERIFPGKCDILFQSHQIFHILVLLATFIDYIGLMKIAHYPHNC